MWSQRAYLKASNAEAGDQFGSGVALAGNTVVVGALIEGSNATGVGGNQANNSAGGAGAVYVFTMSTGTPTPVALVIRREGNEIVLSWPVTSPAFAMDAASGISPAGWVPAGGTPTTDGNTVTLRLPIGVANAFFRLRWP